MRRDSEKEKEYRCKLMQVDASQESIGLQVVNVLQAVFGWLHGSHTPWKR